jgi:phage/plasmid primase, P4 family, C-terminal domain
VSNWETTGFYKSFIQMTNSPDKKEPNGEYTKTTKNHCELNQVQKLSRFMGILDNQSVLVEADEKIHSDNLLKVIQGENLNCMVTTREGGRGIHTLWLDGNESIKKCATGVMLACGIVVDIKIGSKNGLECLKWDNVEREIIHDITPYQNIPIYFTPVSAVKDFAHMKAGSGRNDTFFRYILTLQNAGFNVEQIKETIKIINTYVLVDPIEEKELDLILRDDAFLKQSFFINKKFQHDKLAEFLRVNHHIVMIDKQLHIYQNGNYSYSKDNITIKKAMNEQIPSLTESQRREVLNTLPIICEDTQTAPPNLISFKNGIYNLENDSFLEKSPQIITTNIIPWDYNPNAYSELGNKFLNDMSCGDEQIRKILEECIGSCFYRSNTLAGGKCLILMGEKHNGKSTFLDAIIELLGTDNICALDLRQTYERFKPAGLFGKLANIGDDISDVYMSDPSLFKKLVTGERISVEKKGQDSFEFNSYAKLLFSANEMPRIKDPTGAVQRRLLMIPLNGKFIEGQPGCDTNLKHKLQDRSCMEYFILLGIKGLKRVLANCKYTESELVQRELVQYEVTNNPILSFVAEFQSNDGKFENEPTEDSYKDYKLFCHNNNFQSLSSIAYSRKICKHLGLKSKTFRLNGKRFQIFIKASVKDD